MQIEGKTLELDGFVYTVQMLDPLVATDVLADVLAIVAPSVAVLGNMAADATKGAVEEALDAADAEPGLFEKIGPLLERAVAEFFSRFEKAKQRELIGILAKVTLVATIGEPDKQQQLDRVLTMHFRGRVGALYRWLAFALRVQYADFFVGGGGVIARAAQKLGLAL